MMQSATIIVDVRVNARNRKDIRGVVVYDTIQILTFAVLMYLIPNHLRLRVDRVLFEFVTVVALCKNVRILFGICSLYASFRLQIICLLVISFILLIDSGRVIVIRWISLGVCLPILYVFLVLIIICAVHWLHFIMFSHYQSQLIYINILFLYIVYKHKKLHANLTFSIETS